MTGHAFTTEGTAHCPFMPVFGPPSRMIVRGEGTEVWDSEGRRLLDFLSGIAVVSLGHANERVADAIAEQARTLVHVSNFFANPVATEAAQRIDALLAEATGSHGQIFFTNSGAEANECAIKLARRHGGRGRHTVVSGDSLSTIASRYRVSQQALISLNNLGNADHVEVGQRLRLPNNAVLPQPRAATPKPKPVPVKADPNATSHTVARGQTLTQIAKAYNISVRSLVDINDIGNPNAVDVGTKLLLRQTPQTSNAPLQTQSVQESESTIKPTASDETSTPLLSSTGSGAEEPESTVMASSTTAKASANPAASAAPQEVDWRSYGPLKVDWGNWQTMAGSEVVPLSLIHI